MGIIEDTCVENEGGDKSSEQTATTVPSPHKVGRSRRENNHATTRKNNSATRIGNTNLAKAPN